MLSKIYLSILQYIHIYTIYIHIHIHTYNIYKSILPFNSQYNYNY